MKRLPCQEAKEKLILGHIPLIFRILKQLNVKNWDDKFEYAICCLVEAVNDYKEQYSVTEYIASFIKSKLLHSFCEDQDIRLPKSSYYNGKRIQFVKDYDEPIDNDIVDQIYRKELLELVNKKCPKALKTFLNTNNDQQRYFAKKIIQETFSDYIT